MVSQAVNDLRTIDGIETAKRVYHADSGMHLAVRLRRNSVDLRITERPLHPIMLPIAKRKRFGRNNIKVNKG